MENKIEIFILQSPPRSVHRWVWYWFKASQNGEPFVNWIKRAKEYTCMTLSTFRWFFDCCRENWSFWKFWPTRCVWIHRRIVNYKNQLIQFVGVPRSKRTTSSTFLSLCVFVYFCIRSPLHFCTFDILSLFAILCTAYEFICQIIDNFSELFSFKKS